MNKLDKQSTECNGHRNIASMQLIPGMKRFEVLLDHYCEECKYGCVQ